MRYFLLFLALFVLGGCRSNANQELLERELRLQEDKIFELERLLEDCEENLACREKDERPPRSRGSTSRRRSRDDDYRDYDRRDYDDRDRAPTSPPSVELPEIDVPDDTAPLSPSIEVDESDAAPPFRPPVISPPADAPPGDEAPPFLPNPPARSSSRSELPAPVRAPQSFNLNPQSEDGEFVAAPLTADAVVESITLVETDDDVATADGVTVVVQPRDGDGNVVEVPGKISVVVLDPSKDGDAARAARWDLTEDQVAILFQHSGGEPAIHLELPWPDEQPTHPDLKLYVRYVTADGRKITVDRDLPNVAGATVSADKKAKGRTASSSSGDNAKSSRRITKPTWSPYR